MKFDDNSLSIGNTPLVRLNKITAGSHATVYAKVESRNPSQSVKDRLGAAVIWDGERRGALKPGIEIIEATSGNTGIALASVAAARGYKLTIVMPETMSIERRRLITAFGANLILTPGSEGIKGSIKRVEEIVASEPEKYFLPKQFENPANPKIHELTTAREIFNSIGGGNLDVFIAGVGTGGTITGVATFFKKVLAQPLYTIAVEPSKSPIITQTKSGQPIQPAPHKIQGIGPNLLPKTLDLSLIDRVETVTEEEAFDYARRLSKEEGILSGVSSGAAAAVAVRIAKEKAFTGKTIVVILPDSGERYLSTPLFE